MHRPASVTFLVLLTSLSLAGQPTSDALEDYLEAKGLDELLAVHILEETQQAGGRLEADQAERLSAAYARLLADSQGPDSERWEIASLELLARVDETTEVSSKLRLALARSWYNRSVPAVSQALAGELDPNAVAEAYRLLADASEAFSLVGRRSAQRARSLERRVDQNVQSFVGIDTQAGLEREQRRQSESYYYAGLSEHLLATLDQLQGRDASLRAEQSEDHFAWLFDPTEGRRESVSSLGPERVQAPAAAHAAVMMSINKAYAGQIGQARAWLELAASISNPPMIVQQELPSATLRVLAIAKRWDELATWSFARQNDGGLSIREARLLATLAAQRAQHHAEGRDARDIATCVQIAVRALFEHDDIAHLVTLSRRFEDTLIPGDGFLPRFVRALAILQLAEEEAAQGRDASSRFARGASALTRAIDADDARGFPEQRAEAALRAGDAFAQAGESAREIDSFSRAIELAHSDEQRETAMRHTILAIAPDDAERAEVRADLVVQYRARFPGTDFAIGLLLEDPDSVGDASLDELVAVRADSPVFLIARTLATQRLFQRWQQASLAGKPEAARRYRVVASELLRVRREAYRTGDETSGAPLVDLSLQMLAVLLSTDPADAVSASAILSELDLDLEQRGLPLSREPAELLYRRLQLALVTDDQERAADLESQLERSTGRFSSGAARLVFNRNLAAWQADRDNPERARKLVSVGQRVIRGLEQDQLTGSARSIYETTASAAFQVWQLTDDLAYRSIAKSLDSSMLEVASPTAESLRRLAKIATSENRREQAMEFWLRLLAGAAPASELWLEARYESIVLLARLDRARAVQAIEQYRVISDGWGPEPWGSRFEALNGQLSRSSGRAFDGNGGDR